MSILLYALTAGIDNGTSVAVSQLVGTVDKKIASSSGFRRADSQPLGLDGRRIAILISHLTAALIAFVLDRKEKGKV